MPPLSTLVLSLVMLLLGGAIACLEASLMSLPEARMRALRDELGDRGKLLERYLEDPTRTLSRLLAGRVLFPIAASALATESFVRDGSPLWMLASGVVVTALIYGFVAEIGVTLGRARARSIAPTALFLVRPLEIALAPLAVPLGAVGRLASKILVENTALDASPVTEKEVEYVVEQAQNSGTVDAESSQVIQNVFGMKGRTTRDVMIPRTKVVGLELGTSIPEAVRRVSEEGHSRLPVYREQIDHVVGVIFSKDLFKVAAQVLATPANDTASQPAAGERTSPTSLPQVPAVPTTLDAIMHKPAFFVTDTQTVLAVMRDMQNQRTHIAMVVDEFGTFVGIVTLDDILEELVGEIHDEHHTEESPFIEVVPGRWLVSASLPIGELGEKLSVTFPESEDYASLGGFLGAQAGKVPSIGTVVVWQGLRFIVREGDKHRATTVEIVREHRRMASLPAPPHEEE